MLPLTTASLTVKRSVVQSQAQINMLFCMEFYCSPSLCVCVFSSHSPKSIIIVHAKLTRDVNVSVSLFVTLFEDPSWV